MNTKQIKLQIKKLAKEFDLKYDEKWFKVIWIEKYEEILNEFLSECQDPIYEKYGKSINVRIKNLDKFVNSNDYKKCIKRYGGSATSKKKILEFKKLVNSLFESKIKLKLLNYCDRTLKQLGSDNFTTFLTKTKIKSEYNDLMKSILGHEWIHRFLFQNKIHFSNINKNYWYYDEGLNEYMVTYLDGTLNKLEKFRDKEKYPYEKKYWIYAIKFRSLLKNAKTSKEKKKEILNLMKKLK